MAQDRNSFYVTLPSNGSKNFFSKNTGSNYKNKLATDLELEGCWEVGMAEMQYTRSWKVLKEDGCISIAIFRADTDGTTKPRLTVTSDGKTSSGFDLLYGVRWSPNIHQLKVPTGSVDILDAEFTKGNYSSPEMIAEYVQTTINRAYNSIATLKDAHNNDIVELIKVQYDSVKKRIMFKTSAEAAFLIIYAKDSMGTLLGFPITVKVDHMQSHRIKDWLIAPKAPAAYNTPTLYIYTDIIEQEHVGHDLVQLLRTVPVSGNHGEIVSRLFEKPYYKRVIKKYISSIEVQVNDDTGSLIDFAGDKVICVLHFRRSL